MKHISLCIVSLLLVSTTFSQTQRKTYRKRASSAKITLVNGEVKQGVLFSFSENSISYLPGVKRAKEIDWEKRETKEIASKDIQRISLKKQDRFIISLAVGTGLGLSADLLIREPDYGETPFLNPGAIPEKKGPRIPIVSDLPKVVTGAIVSALVGIFPFVVNISGAEQFSSQQLNKLSRHSLVRPPVPGN